KLKIDTAGCGFLISALPLAMFCAIRCRFGKSFSVVTVVLTNLFCQSRVTLACCKVAVDACFLSYRICCAGSCRVSRPRRSAGRRAPGDAPTVGVCRHAVAEDGGSGDVRRPCTNQLPAEIVR